MENSTAPSFPLQCQYKRFYDMSSVVKQFFVQWHVLPVFLVGTQSVI